MRSTILSLALACGLAALPLAAQDAAETPEISFETTELVPGLYMLEGVGGFAGGNVGLLVGDDGVVLVDDSFPPYTETLLAAVAEVAGGPIDFVLNTHVHGDHVGGNAAVAEDGATIVAHENVRKRLVEDGMPTGDGSAMPAPPQMLPVLTFPDAVTFHLNGQEARVLHVEKAHTDGDAVIHFVEADVIHAGDVLFNGIFPFIDLDNGGSVDGYIAAQEKILELAGDGTRIIAGHGPLATADDLRASIEMLKAARKAISDLIAEGRSVEEVLEARPLEAWEEQSWSFITTERMIRQLYKGLSG